METYILESQGYIKIGRAENIRKRIKAYHTHNPNFKVLRVIEGDYELKLHYMFKDKLHKGEWFLLSKEDIECILSEDIVDKCNILSKGYIGYRGIQEEEEVVSEEERMSRIKGVFSIEETVLLGK